MADTTKLGEIPESVRQVAETTLGKAREAIDSYLKQATDAFDKVGGQAATAQTDAQAIARKAAGFASANVTAALDLAQQLVKAKSLEEVAALNKSYIEAQTQQFKDQFGELGQDASTSAKGFAASFTESANEIAAKALKTTQDAAQSVGEAVKNAANKANPKA